ncbi:hypothetical protein [Flindersiella endophytica]
MTTKRERALRKRRTRRMRQLGIKQATTAAPASPLWARGLRQVAIWGGAGVLAAGTYVGAAWTASMFLDEQKDEAPLVAAAAALGEDRVYVDPRAAGVLDEADLSALRAQATEANRPTKVVVWPLDRGWLPDIAEYVAARTNVEGRFLFVDGNGRTAVASTLAESEPSIPGTEGSPAAEAATQALEALDAVPLRGEREEYDDGGQPVGSIWLAAAAGGGLGLLIVLVAASGAVVALSSVLLVVMFGLLAALAYRSRKAGPAIANIEARPAQRRRANRLAYRPPNDVLVRLNKVRAAERAERLRDELLALGERLSASTHDVAGDTWALALDCYETAGRIADTADAAETGDSLSTHADVVAGLVLVARGRQAAGAAESGSELTGSADCFANPFHGPAVGPVPTIALAAERPPASAPQQADVCATCHAAARKGVAVADPLVLDSGNGHMQPYWMLDVKPWSETGYGIASRELIDAWNSSKV